MKKKEKAWLWILMILLTISGLAYWYFKKLYTNPDPFALGSHPMQAWMMRAHLLLAPLFVFLLGWISLSHVRPRYRSKISMGRKTGILNFFALVICVLTGYYLQLLTSKAIANYVGWVHVITGLIALVYIWVH